MKKNSSLLIAGGVGIIAIIIIVAFYNNQEPKVIEPEVIEPIEFHFNNSNSQLSDIDKKLNEIEAKANQNYFEPSPREWITSGPFQIDRSEYLIGEKIFIRIGGLDEEEKGQIAILRPTNETHYTVHQTIPFDGVKKNAFNYYTEVRLSQALGICSTEDIIGEWTIVFRGTNYENIKIEFIDEILPGEEDSFEKPVC